LSISTPLAAVVSWIRRSSSSCRSITHRPRCGYRARENASVSHSSGQVKSAQAPAPSSKWVRRQPWPANLDLRMRHVRIPLGRARAAMCGGERAGRRTLGAEAAPRGHRTEVARRKSAAGATSGRGLANASANATARGRARVGTAGRSPGHGQRGWRNSYRLKRTSPFGEPTSSGRSQIGRGPGPADLNVASNV